MTNIEKLKEEHKMSSSDAKFSTAVDNFNSIQDRTYRDQIVFYDKLALMSAGVVSISVAFLPKLKEQNGDVINQYSLLFIFGVALFILCVFLGLSYRLLLGKLNWHASLSNVAKRTHEHAFTVGEAVKNGYAIDVSDYPEGFEKYISDFKTIHERETKNRNYYSKMVKVVKYLAPICFISGTIFVSIYFIVQIFNFDF